MVAFRESIISPPALDDFLNEHRSRLGGFYRRASHLEAALMDAVIAARFMLVASRAASAIDEATRAWQEAVGRELTDVGRRLGALVRMSDAFASLPLAEQREIVLTALDWPGDDAGR